MLSKFTLVNIGKFRLYIMLSNFTLVNIIYILLKIMIIHKNYLYKLYFTTFLIKKINQMRKLSGGLNVYSKFGFRSIVFYDCIKFYSKKKMGRKQEKIMEIEKKK